MKSSRTDKNLKLIISEEDFISRFHVSWLCDEDPSVTALKTFGYLNIKMNNSKTFSWTS